MENRTVGMFDVQVCNIDYAPFGGERTYRHVVSRQKNCTGQTDAIYGDDFTYRSIATNYRTSTDREIIEYYNHMGTTEKISDGMNTDLFRLNRSHLMNSICLFSFDDLLLITAINFSHSGRLKVFAEKSSR